MSPFSVSQEKDFARLTTLFLEENKITNLSSIRDERGVKEKHIFDSFRGAKILPNTAKNILDFGSGGGFPALPLAILFSDKHFTALDSVGKKIHAVKKIAEKMGLQNMNTKWVRGEEWAHEKTARESFDAVLSRAAAPFPMLLEIAGAFVKKSGFLLVYIGPNFDERYIKKAEKLAFLFQKRDEYKLPSGEKRAVILFQKSEKMAKKYPRPFSTIKKEPLF